MTEENFTIEWRGSGGKATEPPNPEFPNGVDLDLTRGEAGCSALIPYPAPEVGMWVLKCALCGMSVAVTAAGRIDDPRRVKIPCKIEGHA